MACRFSSVSAENIEALKAGAENENTSKATAVWLRTVTEFRKAKTLDISFATCSAEEFNESSALKSLAFQIQAHCTTIQGMTVNIPNTYNMMPAAVGVRKKKRLALKKKE